MLTGKIEKMARYGYPMVSITGHTVTVQGKTQQREYPARSDRKIGDSINGSLMKIPKYILLPYADDEGNVKQFNKNLLTKNEISEISGGRAKFSEEMEVFFELG